MIDFPEKKEECHAKQIGKVHCIRSESKKNKETVKRERKEKEKREA